jgi:DNA-binding transcriptional regulator GbsR (MarR family)
MSKSLSNEEGTFVEEVGIVFEQTGLPRMAGRVFGWLLISEPAFQSPSELADVLMASKGSISTTVRLLIQMGLIDRHIIPGERHDHFQISEDALKRTVQHGLEEEIKLFRSLAQNGLDLMKNEDSVRRRWLDEMHSRYAFLEKYFPTLMERYERKQAKLKLKLLLKNSKA